MFEKNCLPFEQYKNNNLDKGIVSFPNYDTSPWNIVNKKEDYLKKEHYWWILKEDDIIEEYEKYSEEITLTSINKAVAYEAVAQSTPDGTPLKILEGFLYSP